MSDETRRLEYVHFGRAGHELPFVAWKFEGDELERRRAFDTWQEAQDAYNELARHAQTYGVVPSCDPVAVSLVESVNFKDARIAALESCLAAKDAEIARLREEATYWQGCLASLGTSCMKPKALVDLLKQILPAHELAAAHEASAREFAEWLDAEHDSGINTVWVRYPDVPGGRAICAVRDAARRFLASRGTAAKKEKEGE